MSPSSQAARKRRATSSRSSRETSKRRRPSSTWRCARARIWRQFVGALADDPRDVVVGVVEDLAQQEDGALDRRELLEQVQERQRERVRRLGVANRLVVDERLGQPLARIDLAADAGRAQLVDREPRRDRREVRLRRLRARRRPRGSAGTRPGRRPPPRPPSRASGRRSRTGTAAAPRASPSPSETG